MYIEYNGKKYDCGCKPRWGNMVYTGLPEDFPAPVNAEIKLYADDGFLMRTDNPNDYLRQTFENGTLTLTDEPKPEEPIEPVEPEEETETADDVLNVLLGVV